jgi:hypothetical protein
MRAFLLPSLVVALILSVNVAVKGAAAQAAPQTGATKVNTTLVAAGKSST